MELQAKSGSDWLVIETNSDLMEFEDSESELMEMDEQEAYDIAECATIREKSDLVFVDVQGFRDRKARFICKEFCLVSGDEVYHAIIKSPYRFGKMLGYYKNQANYNTKYIHGLTWECGDVHLIDFLQIAYMKTLGKKIVVKGDQKVKWLEYLFRNCGEIDCANMENWGYCKSVHVDTQVHGVCDYHFNNYSGNWKFRCAKENALKLQEIITKYKLDTRNV